MTHAEHDHACTPGRSEPEPGTPSVRRRRFLAGAAFGAVTAASASLAAPAAAAVREGTASGPSTTSAGRTARLPEEVSDVIEAWARAPFVHPLIGDWRRAGYRRGTTRPRAARGRITSAADLGIRPGGSRDVSGALQAALDDLGARGGGVLRFDDGRYVLDNPLFIHDSHVVLRGAGTGRTVLHFTRPLEQSIGSGHDKGGQSVWSWTGGQVFFIARERLAASRAAHWTDKSAAEGWLPGPTLATVTPATRGSDVLLVDDTSKITAGDMVLLEVDNLPDRRLLKEMVGDIDGAQTYDWSGKATRISAPTMAPDFTAFRWPVVVTDVLSPRTVRIEQPLRLTVHRETPARLRALGPTLHDSGVEALTIDNTFLPQTVHNKNPGSNGVCFQAVYDCWANNIRVTNADCAFAMTAAKSCSLSGISNRGRASHHFVVCRVQSHDNLVENFRIEDFSVPVTQGAYFHGLNVEGFASGNVYRSGVMETGTFDSHRQLPFENLRTDITMTNSVGSPGGALDAGPRYGARSVHWGVKVTSDRQVCIEVTDAAPRSLTAGITGTKQPGSSLGNEFGGDLESERLAFGVDLAGAKDLLNVQRAQAPLR
ncbi:hypothetical protein ACYSUO_07265 [Streptomyces sp. UC4497]